MAETNLRQTDRRIEVIGKVAELALEEGKTKTGKDCIKGTVSVKVDELNTIPFKVMTMRVKNDGTENNAYKGLQTVMAEYKSIAQVGEEAATNVEVSGSLEPSTYKGQDGQLHEGAIKFTGNYFNRNSKNKANKAELNIEVYITGIVHEVDKDGNETGRAILKGWTSLYDKEHGTIIEPVQLVAGEDLAGDLETTYTVGQTARFFCDIINTSRVIRKEIQVALGKPRIEERTEFKQEFVITGATPAYEEDNVKDYISPEVIKAAVQVREERKEAIKNADNKPETAQKAAKSDKVAQW